MKLNDTNTRRENASERKIYALDRNEFVLLQKIHFTPANCA